MKITFKAESKAQYEICPKPKPASEYVPEWGLKQDIHEQTTRFDLLSAGYIIPLWSDVLVEQDETNFNISWRVQDNVFEPHGESEVAIPSGYGPQAVKYNNPWIPRLPKGYSLLIMPPVGYPDTPFRLLPAIIDYDKTSHVLHPPGFIKSDFNGIIERGTPMIQVIPFKRDNWESGFEWFEEGGLEIMLNRDVNSVLGNHYLKKFWSKKNFK